MGRIAVLVVKELTTVDVDVARDIAYMAGVTPRLRTIVFSTGILEFAIRHYYDVWIVSHRDRIAPIDDWWSIRVPLSKTILTENGDYLSTWRTLYDALLFTWRNFAHPDMARRHLDRCGIVLSEELYVALHRNTSLP